MKYFIFYIVTVFVPVFSGIALVNYTLDPGHIYQSQKYIDKVIEGIREGYNVEGITDIDERTYKLQFAELHKGESFDYLALGSSRIMTVSKDILHGSSFLNLSVSSCQIEELIAFYQICKDFNIHYSNLLISADPYVFNGHYIDDRWKCLGDYVNEYMGKDVTGQRIDWDILWNLFSVSYFKTALHSCMTDNNNLKYVKTAINNEGETFRTDGSFCWSRSIREAPQSIIDGKARTMHFHTFKNFYDISEDRIALFTKLLEDIKADGVNVYLVRSPFHPIYYKELIKLKGVLEAFDFIENYARKNNIPLIGNYNPVKEGLCGSDFYDGPHVRKEVLDRIVERELFLKYVHFGNTGHINPETF